MLIILVGIVIGGIFQGTTGAIVGGLAALGLNSIISRLERRE